MGIDFPPPFPLSREGAFDLRKLLLAPALRLGPFLVLRLADELARFAKSGEGCLAEGMPETDDAEGGPAPGFGG